MIGPENSSITALSALNKRMTVTADNIANVNTDGFKKSRVVIASGGRTGVTATVQRIDTPGPPNPDAVDDPGLAAERSNVDLTREIPRMIPTQRSYDANLKALRTQSDMIGTLIDTMG